MEQAPGPRARHVLTILAVEDLPRAVAFYGAAFGWPQVEAAPVYAEFALPGGLRLGVYQREAFGRNTGQEPARLAPDELAPTELYFHVDDLEEAIRRLQAAGARTLSARAVRAWGDEAAYLADPDGNVLVVARPWVEAASRATRDPRVAPLLAELRAMGSERDRAGMARYGINVEQAFGVSIHELRRVARRLGADHGLALELWSTGNHEARLLACFVDDPAEVTEAQAEAWVRDFDSWDVCDQAATSLLDRTSLAWAKARAWAVRDEPWVRRAGFALMAGLAVHDQAATDRAFVRLLPLIERAAWDERNFVKKAVNWALRNIGKRNQALNAAAIACAERIRAAANRQAGGERGGEAGARAARWVAADALRELGSEKVKARLRG
jgi:3-methyladenine DNA glycosylase AlkD/predicted enzyme related to lactoylglutathione lyase